MSLLSTLVSANTSFSHLKLLWSMYACSFTQLCLTLCHPNGLEPSRLLCQWNFPGRNTGVGCHFLLQGSSQHRDQSVSPMSLVLAGRFSTIEPPGKPLWSTKKSKLNALTTSNWLIRKKETWKNVRGNFMKNLKIENLSDDIHTTLKSI